MNSNTRISIDARPLLPIIPVRCTPVPVPYIPFHPALIYLANCPAHLIGLTTVVRYLPAIRSSFLPFCPPSPIAHHLLFRTTPSPILHLQTTFTWCACSRGGYRATPETRPKPGTARRFHHAVRGGALFAGVSQPLRHCAPTCGRPSDIHRRHPSFRF